MNSHIDAWILNFDSSFHVTSNKHWFDHLRESNHGHVIAWDGVSYNITGVGNVIVRFDISFVHTLKDARYIPHIGENLISVEELARKCFTSGLDGGIIKMFKGSFRALNLLKKMTLT